MELATLLLFAFWLVNLVLTLPDTRTRVAWLLLSHGFAGILHVQICISHFGMEHFNGGAYQPGEESMEWFQLQLRTTMNVDCAPYMDWFHGGLQFQIEHHMYPRLPRHSLREAQTRVEALCKKHKVHHHKVSFFQSNVELLTAMYQTAQKVKQTKLGDGGFYESPLYDGLNAIG